MIIDRFIAESDLVARRVRVAWTLTPGPGETLADAPRQTLRRKTRDFEFPQPPGYHAIIEPKTKQLLSLSIDVIGKDGEKATKTIAEADLEKAAADFVRSQNLLATADFQLVRTSEATDNDLKRYFYYSDGHNAIAIGVDTALKQVVTFTYD